MSCLTERANDVLFGATSVRKPEFNNQNQYDKMVDEYRTPNGPTIFIDQDCLEDKHDLRFHQQDWTTIFEFWLANKGIIFTYTDHHDIEHNALFRRGPRIVEKHDDCTYNVQVELQYV
ncbi:MAG: hypothetical protein CL489_06155 [Acidobacteria bacterium]|nr:hypothetical protein [Acidobacteriota bacterium]|tara:strand:+ start:23395 stop:23748 length:354 start_codon:yes stop_codon:yes gene_type:complete